MKVMKKESDRRGKTGNTGADFERNWNSHVIILHNNNNQYFKLSPIIAVSSLQVAFALTLVMKTEVEVRSVSSILYERPSTSDVEYRRA